MKTNFSWVWVALTIVFLGTGAAGCGSSGSNSNSKADKEGYMIVGTYSRNGSEGIYVYSFNHKTGEAKLVSTKSGVFNPSFLTIVKDRVYAVSESGGENPGSVTAYRFDRKSGTLDSLNKQETGGDGPCYVDADDSGKLVATGNYSGGSVTVFHVNDDGSLKENKQVMQHTGSSVHPRRQQRPHAHQAIFTPDQKFLLSPDLGKDRIMVYSVNHGAENPLALFSEIVVTPGGGPRQVAFHPTKPYMYMIQELEPRVVMYQYEGGNFSKIDEVPAYPQGFEGAKDGAAIKVSPDGRFVYTTNRAEQNAVGIFEIDQNTGKVTNKGFQPAGGKGPRDFEIDPSGNFIVVANQQTNNLVTFKRNKETGMLTEISNVEMPIPVCVKFTSK